MVPDSGVVSDPSSSTKFSVCMAKLHWCKGQSGHLWSAMSNVIISHMLAHICISYVHLMKYIATECLSIL